MILIHLQVQRFCLIRTVDDDDDDDEDGWRLLHRVNEMITVCCLSDQEESNRIKYQLYVEADSDAASVRSLFIIRCNNFHYIPGHYNSQVVIFIFLPQKVLIHIRLHANVVVKPFGPHSRHKLTFSSQYRIHRTRNASRFISSHV